MQRADMPVDDLQQQHAEQLTAGESQHRGPGVDLGEEQLHPGRGEPAQHTGEVAGDPVAPDDRSSGGADFAAAVGRGGRICSQQLAELGRVAALGCRQEALDEPVPLGSVRLESRARGTETLAGSAMKLPGVGLRDVEKPGDLPMAVGERLPQYENGPLGGGEPLHEPQQRKGHRIALLHGPQRIQRTISGQHRLRQPGADVGLPPGPLRRQPVQAEVGDHLGQPRGRVGNLGAGGAGPTQVRVLDNVLRLARLAQHPVGQAEQPGPLV